MDPIWIALGAAIAFALFVAFRGGASSADVLEALESGVPVLDVRSPGEFASGHAKGAINIPVDQLSGRLAELGEPGRIVVYCKSGMRSSAAARTLKAAGFDVLDAKRLGAIPPEHR